MLDIKAEFHSMAARATRNRFLAEALMALREKAYAVRYASWQDPNRARETVEVHEEMIRALRARDGARYRALVLDHVSGPLDEYRQRLSAPAPARTHLIGVRRRPRRGRS
jgi:DNA-binding GntR family transcriptional regulator